MRRGRASTFRTPRASRRAPAQGRSGGTSPCRRGAACPARSPAAHVLLPPRRGAGSENGRDRRSGNSSCGLELRAHGDQVAQRVLRHHGVLLALPRRLAGVGERRLREGRKRGVRPVGQHRRVPERERPVDQRRRVVRLRRGSRIE